MRTPGAAQGLVMLLCVAAFDWRREAAKAALAAGGWPDAAEQSPALQPLLDADGSADSTQQTGPAPV